MSKRQARAVLIVAIMCLCVPGAYADEFPLDYVVPARPEISLGGFLSKSQYGDRVSAVPPAQLKQIPSFKSKWPLYFTIQVSNQNFTCVFDESKGTGKGYDTLLVDANGDRWLETGKPYRAKPNNEASSFYDVRLKVRVESQQLPYAVAVSLDKRPLNDGGSTAEKGWFCQVHHIGHRKGSIKVGEQTVQIIAFDANGNGKYKDSSVGGGTDRNIGDLLFLDWNDDRVLDWLWEYSPANKSALVVLNKQFYEMRLLPGGQKVVVTDASPAMGSIHTNYLRCRVRLISDSADLVIATADGVIHVPAGDYQLTAWEVETAGLDGAAWKLGGRENQRLVVKENETLELSFIASPVATVVVDKMIGVPPKLTTSIKTATGGEVLRLERNGKTFIAPIDVIDASGKSIVRLQFPNTQGPGIPDWWWDRPQGMKGPHRAVPDLTSLPLTIEVHPSDEFK